MNNNFAIDAEAIFERLSSERAVEIGKTANWDRRRTRELLMIVTRGAGPGVWAH